MEVSITALHFFLALLPIIAVLLLMVAFQWGGTKAGPVGWLISLVIAMAFFGASPTLIAYSQMRALMLTLYVLYVIWMALLLYNVINEAGAIERIGGGIISITGNKVLQLLILSWVFSSFLQGFAGYGVPIAVVAPLLIGLGFTPVTAVASIAVGHAWSVTFGSIAASFNALIATSGMAGADLAGWSAILLGIVCYLCGAAAAYSYQGWKSIRQGLPAILILGTAMAVTQYWMATRGMWNVAALVAGIVGLFVSLLVARLKPYKANHLPENIDGQPTPAGTNMPLMLAMGAYIILILMVGLAELVPPVHTLLNGVKLQLMFPETQTALGWTIAASKGQSISVFGHAGALLIYTSVLSYLLYYRSGRYQPGAINRILSNTYKNGLKSSIGIASMVGFALIMEQSGMTNAIATGLSSSIQAIFPIMSPFIGLLGSFMTGSNTNSNIVFAGLQKQTADLLKISPAIILAAQTTGGAIGGMLAPARIIVGCSTAGLVGKEGLVLRRTFVYGLIMTALIGVVVYFLVR